MNIGIFELARAHGHHAHGDARALAHLYLYYIHRFTVPVGLIWRHDGGGWYTHTTGSRYSFPLDLALVVKENNVKNVDFLFSFMYIHSLHAVAVVVVVYTSSTRSSFWCLLLLLLMLGCWCCFVFTVLFSPRVETGGDDAGLISVSLEAKGPSGRRKVPIVKWILHYPVTTPSAFPVGSMYRYKF